MKKLAIASLFVAVAAMAATAVAAAVWYKRYRDNMLDEYEGDYLDEDEEFPEEGEPEEPQPEEETPPEALADEIPVE